MTAAITSPAEDVSLAELVTAVESAAVSYRAGVERHEDLATRRRWNPDLLPSERRQAFVLGRAAEVFREMARQKQERKGS